MSDGQDWVTACTTPNCVYTFDSENWFDFSNLPTGQTDYKFQLVYTDIQPADNWGQNHIVTWNQAAFTFVSRISWLAIEVSYRNRGTTFYILISRLATSYPILAENFDCLPGLTSAGLGGLFETL